MVINNISSEKLEQLAEVLKAARQKGIYNKKISWDM